MPRRRRPRAEVWAPLSRHRQRRWRPDYDAFIYECAWTQDARIQLLILRDLLERQACHLEAMIEHAPQRPLDVRHHQVAKDAVAILDCLLAHQPRFIIIGLDDCLAGGVLLFLDSVVGLLLEAGPMAGQMLERMGYRPYRATTILTRLGSKSPGPPAGYYRPARPQPTVSTWWTTTPHDCKTVYRPASPLGGTTIILKK